jgi:osmotically inducible protein OsmC
LRRPRDIVGLAESSSNEDLIVLGRVPDLQERRLPWSARRKRFGAARAAPAAAIRFESEKGTNPEELIAAAHAGCFTMALAFGLQGAGFTPAELTTEAAVTLEPEGKGFRISRSVLTLRAQVPNLDETKFAEMAKDAEKNCPVSKVLNAEITLDAKLV